jgi:transcriptional regulator with XRE-family HTH domain
MVLLDARTVERRRRARLLTVSDLCQVCGLSRRTVDRARLGEAISLQSAKRIAAALRKSVRSLTWTGDASGIEEQAEAGFYESVEEGS